ncbi:zinc-dependent alcohol dehydrogenase family protein [Sphingobium subterraneum]|uniref:NADPH:quinone reductase-like Zn-dependent oxidoreductase n=1 Tax=Sphingobium subterraneum TaxID=627688 RepID=A0A841J9W5_9SPHN|nr:NAD(P)-dependent alcohol dehydrogenase [Sphingobium subterraneum]MBB6125358.1 NADPH:quinone reductase-like Zn-dependent oxidoreductase [Sphingobium subterraneum]
MRRWVLDKAATDVSGLRIQEVAVPQPGPHEVRVRVQAASFNRRDQMVLSGIYGRAGLRDLVPLSDGAGVVDALGEGVQRWRLGDRVAATYFANWQDGPPRTDMGLGLGAGDEDGMLSEYVVLAEDRLVAIPNAIDMTTAATLPCAALTAWNAVMGGLQPLAAGHSLLALGTGGVSLFALQFAGAAGAVLHATSSSEAKCAKLRDLGVKTCHDYSRDDQWGAAIFAATGGVDKVVDVGGAGTMNNSLAALRPEGEVAMVGFLAGNGEPPDPYLLQGKQAIIRGVAVGSAHQFEEMTRFIVRHRIEPVIAAVLPFEDAPRAYGLQDAPEIFGKVVISVC